MIIANFVNIAFDLFKCNRRSVDVGCSNIVNVFAEFMCGIAARR